MLEELFIQHPETIRSPRYGYEVCSFGRRGRGRCTAHVESRRDLARFVETALGDMGAVLVLVYQHGRLVARFDLRRARFRRRVDAYNG